MILTKSLTKHYQETGSSRAKRVLGNMDEALTKMWAVIPNSEKSNAVIQNSASPATNSAVAK